MSPRSQHLAHARPRRQRRGHAGLAFLALVSLCVSALSLACRPDLRIGEAVSTGEKCESQDDCPYYLLCVAGGCYETCAAGQAQCQYGRYSQGHCQDKACLPGARAPTGTTPTYEPPTPTPTTTATATVTAPSCFTAPPTGAVPSAFGISVQPPTAPTDCTAQQASDFFIACLGSPDAGTASQAACDSFIADGGAANEICTSCLFERFSQSRLALLYAGLGGKSTFIELSACIALNAGKPQCAAPLARLESCRVRQCFACADDATTATCAAYADATSCSSLTLTAECKALDLNKAARAACIGNSFEDTYTRNATILCVSGPP